MEVLAWVEEVAREKVVVKEGVVEGVAGTVAVDTSVQDLCMSCTATVGMYIGYTREGTWLFPCDACGKSCLCWVKKRWLCKASPDRGRRKTARCDELSDLNV
eukprot:6197269-Pleurochrysis_carterae.AAC.1